MAEKKIGALEYRCTPAPAYETVRMGRRLANLFGPALPGVVQALRQEGEADRDAAALAAFGAMAVNLDDRFDATIKELAEMVQVKWNGGWEDVQVAQDELVQDAGTLMLIAFFALEVNFKSFFSGPLAKALANQTRASQKDG